MKLSAEMKARIIATEGVIVRCGQPVVPTPARISLRRLRRPPALLDASCRVLGLEVAVPLQVRSEANLRHWQGRCRRTRDARLTWTALVLKFGLPKPALPAVVTFTRLGGKPMDDDNLAGAMKGLRDEIAAWLGVGDAKSDPVRWHYSQLPHDRIGVVVRIQSMEMP